MKNTVKIGEIRFTIREPKGKDARYLFTAGGEDAAARLMEPEVVARFIEEINDPDVGDITVSDDIREYIEELPLFPTYTDLCNAIFGQLQLPEQTEKNS